MSLEEADKLVLSPIVSLKKSSFIPPPKKKTEKGEEL